MDKCIGGHGPQKMMSQMYTLTTDDRMLRLDGTVRSLALCKRIAVIVSMLLILMPLISSAAEISSLFHAGQQDQSSMPCHDETAPAVQCCCHAQNDGQPCQCSSGDCVSGAMTLMLSASGHAHEKGRDIHPAFARQDHHSLSPPIALRPPISHL